MTGSGPSYGGVPIGEFLVVCASLREKVKLPDLTIHLLGVGKTSAAMRLSALVRAHPSARAVLLYGIAGAFPARHRSTPAPVRLGEVCIVGSDRFGDEGVETPAGFVDIEEVLEPRNLGPRYATEGGKIFGGPSTFPSNPRMAQQAAELLGVPIVHGVTVSTCSGTEATSERMRRRSSADVETMEGAAVAYVCRQLELPLLHVRAISNWTGDRDRGEWDIGTAVMALQSAVQRLFARS
ncbi:MAG TPA: futalosine hydrolase [Planctomycetota bacterium]